MYAVKYGVHFIQDKVAEKLASIKPATSTKSPEASGSSTESEIDKMERVNRLIPPELQMPPVTEADLADLARDIESLGYMSGERTTVLKHESDNSPPSTGDLYRYNLQSLLNQACLSPHMFVWSVDLQINSGHVKILQQLVSICAYFEILLPIPCK